MQVHEVASPPDHSRVLAGLPFVEALARRLAASMPHSIDIGDLVQDGVLGLMDAANRFDVDRGIKFETFAERRVRGAMIDALRREAWPRGVRRVRREIEAAREALRLELGHEPSVADLAARVGSDEKRLNRTIVRINTLESTSPLSAGDHVSETSLPAALVPSEPEAPDQACFRTETRDRVRRAILALPPRERRLISLYYFRDVTMKQIGLELGVNESRVSQLHARAIQRLRKVLALAALPAAARAVAPSFADPAVAAAPVNRALVPKVARKPAHQAPTKRPFVPIAAKPADTADLFALLRASLLSYRKKEKSEAADLDAGLPVVPVEGAEGVARVLPYAMTSRAARSKSPRRNGFASQRQPVSSRKRSASVPATSPVTKMIRRDIDAFVAAMAR
jgi:RNA polymerase sigma factor for flagellar operon FliA